MKHISHSSQSFSQSAQRILGAGMAIAISAGIMLPSGTWAASAWSPTLLVNTESFQIIDSGDGSTDIELRFGDSNQRLFYDTGAARFEFTKSVLIQGNLTTTGSLSVKRAISGATLRIDGNADVWGSLSATGAIKSKTGAILNADNDTNDVSLVFGNQTAAQSLKFMHALQRFELTKALWVNGNLSASGALAVQNDISTRANLKINGDSEAADATVTFGSDGADQSLKFANTADRFEFDDDVKTNGGFSGKTLTIDDTVTLNGVAYEFTGAQGGTNTFLRNAGNGTLTWAATSTGPSSGNVLSLHPEYPNATYTASGSATVGQLTYSGALGTENLYRWTTSKATLQSYTIAVRVRVPQNFSHWEGGSGIVLRVRTGTTTATDNHITVRVKDTTGASVAVASNESITSLGAGVWRTVGITGLASNGTFTPGGYMTILVKVAATSAGAADLGYMDLRWTTTTP